MGINLFEGCGFEFETTFLNALTENQNDKFIQFVNAFEEAFAQLCKECPAILSSRDVPDDSTKLRFLQADGYKVNLAVKRLINCITWRQQLGASRMVSNGPPNSYETYKKSRISRHLG